MQCVQGQGLKCPIWTGKPHETVARGSYPSPLVALVTTNSLLHLLARQPVGGLINRGPSGSVNRRLDDIFSTPFTPDIIKYKPSRGFIVPKFFTYEKSSDPFDHIMHYKQLVTLDIGNDALLCKVFPTSLQGQAFSWFHYLPMNFVDNFQNLSEAFIRQYMCLARHKQNISTLQNIKVQENKSWREFVKRFGHAVHQVESYSMDVVLQIFKRSICPGTPFLESLAKKPHVTMDDLFKQATSTPCQRTMSTQLLSRFWSPSNLLGMTQSGALRLQANEGRWVGGKMDNIS